MKKVLAILLSLLMMFTFVSCTKTNGDNKEPIEITGSGTSEDPWNIGATENDTLTATLEDGFLTIEGFGSMVDFENLEDRPWNDQAKDIHNISIFAEVDRIGKNAFKGLGNSEEFLSIYYDVVKCFGESCFEDCNLFGNILTIPATTESVESKAFANTNLDQMELYCNPNAIAEDAFSGITADVRVLAKDGWTDADKKQFGGNLTYHNLYVFSYNFIYDTEDVSASGSMNVPDDWDIDFNADDQCYDGQFIKYEVVSGNLDIDLENPQINGYLTEDVELNIYYHYTGEEGDIEPETNPAEGCLFVVTKEDGSEVLFGDSEDADCQFVTYMLMAKKSGLTIAMPEGTDVINGSVYPEEGVSVKLDNLNLEGNNVYLSVLAANTCIELSGVNRFVNSDTLACYLNQTTKFTGNGTVYISSLADVAAVAMGEGNITESYEILGSAESNAEVEGLVPVEYKVTEDGAGRFYVGGAECKTILIKAK